MFELALILIVAGSPIVAAMLSIAFLDRLAPRRRPAWWWPFIAAWWFPLLLLAYGIHMNRTSQCLPGDECGGLGKALVELMGLASVGTGLVVGPFAASLTLRYLRKP